MRQFYLPISWITGFLILFCTFFISGCKSPDIAVQEPTFDREFFEGFGFSNTWLDISEETSDSRATFWKPDGTIIFVVGRDSDNIAAYEMAVPWEVNTGSFMTSISIPGTNQHGLYIRGDGKRMWVFDRTGIWTYQLEESWDISTISEGEYTDLSSFVIRGHDIDFRPDGRVIYIDDRNKGAVFQVSLENPWDVTGYELQYTLDISDLQMEVRGVEFLNEGKAMALMDTGRKKILQYELGEAWNISTAVYKGGFDVSAQTHQGRGLSFSADETRFYVTGRDEQKIFQYHR